MNRHYSFLPFVLCLFFVWQGSQDPLQLEPGKPIEREIAGGQSHAYRIVLIEGQFLRVIVTQRGIDVIVALYGPEDKQIIEIDSLTGAQGDEIVSAIAEVNGNHRLEIRPFEKNASVGRYEVKIETIRPSTEDDRKWIEAQHAYVDGEGLRRQATAESHRQAVEKYKSALTLWSKLGDRAGEVASLNGIATIYNIRGERQKALETYQQVLQIRRELKDRPGEGGALHHIALVHQGLNERDKALQNYGEALKIRREVGDRQGEANTLLQLGVLSRQMGNYQQAFDFYNQALLIYQSVGNKRGEATTIGNIGTLFLFQGKRKEALPHLERAYEIQRALGPRRQEAVSLYNIGAVYNELGEQQKALDYLDRALQLWHEIGDQPGEAATLQMIGTVHSEMGEMRRALDYFNQARPLLRSTGGPAQEALAIFTIGGIHQTLGDRQQALDYHQQALAHWRAAKDPALQAAALHSIGVLYLSLGERQIAIEHFNQALELRRKLGNPFEEANVLNSLGVASTVLGEKEKALEYFDRALILAKDNRRITANTLNATTPIYNDRGEHQKSLDNLNRALALTRENSDRPAEAETLHNLGRTHLALKDLAQARKHLEQSLSIYRGIGNRSAQAGALYGLARVEFDDGDLDAARSRIEAALEIVESLRSKLGSQELRASYFASVHGYYDLYVQVLMKMHERQSDRGFDGEALQASERARARSLLEILGEANANIREGVDDSLIERERSLQQRLSGKADAVTRLFTGPSTPERAVKIDALKREIDALNAEHQQVWAEIRRASPRYAALTQPAPLSVKEIQQALDEDTLLLEYSLGAERSFLWAVTNNSLTSYELPKEEQIAQAAKEVYNLLTARSRPQKGETLAQRLTRITQAEAQLPQAARQLSQMLLGPAAAQLGGKRLVIVADGALQYLPFAVLPNPNKTTPEPLIVNHEIVSLPSASTLAVQRRELAGRRPAPKMIAVLADPVFAASDVRLKAVSPQAAAKPDAPAQMTAVSLENARIIEHLGEASAAGTRLAIPRLPFTRRESEQILALSPKTSALKATDFKASRATATSAELSQYRYLHFATHGLLDSERPGLSALALSLVNEQGEPQDGFLRAHEIYNLNLPAELVVLSACQTGLGKEIKGEGLVGLTRGFMYARAARVVVSLWSVNDKATSELMTRFYRKMLKDGQRPAAALRAAQVEMWKQKQWQAPFYWAAFVLQGEWR